MTHLGDFAAGATVRKLFDTFDLGGAPATIGSLAAHVLKDGDAANITTGVAVATDLDGTGVHKVEVDLSASGAVYAEGHDFAVVITGSLNGTSIRRVLAEFSIGRTIAARVAAAIADKILGRNLAGGSDGGRTVQDALRPLRNKVVATGDAITVFQEDDATEAWSGIVGREALNTMTSVDPA